MRGETAGDQASAVMRLLTACELSAKPGTRLAANDALPSSCVTSSLSVSQICKEAIETYNTIPSYVPCCVEDGQKRERFT